MQSSNGLFLWSALVLAAACGGSSNGNVNAGYDPNCKPASGNTLNTSCNPGFTQQAPNKAGSIQVTFSGEQLGELTGLTFDPSVTNPNLATQFVDGWSMQFDELLVVLGNFRLSPGATQYSSQSTLNAAVATKVGPYVVDMHNPPHDFTAAAGEPAGALFKWDTQDSGQAFDTSVRYAFSYDTLQAKYPVANVNLTSAQQADYDMMVTNGWSKLYRGTATFVGNPNAGTYPNKAKFDLMPQTVKFFFGFNDAASLINCVNPSNSGATGGDDLAARGVQPSPTGAVTAQVTMHVDHLFWDRLIIHGQPLRFDPIAAWAPASAATTAVDLRSILLTPTGGRSVAATFSDGTPMNDRGPIMWPAFTTDMTASGGNVVYDRQGVPTVNVPDLINFMVFSTQTQMHLNADGLCYTVGQHPNDPYFTPNIH